MSVLDILLGKPIATSDERGEQVGVSAGISIFGLDALSSAAYGPEAALTLLIPLGLAGVAYIVPISASIIVLLTIVYFSYRQTIAAYPAGGGSYTVASENLGTFPGLLAAAALMIDYILTAAVGISAGVGAFGVRAPEPTAPHAVTLPRYSRADHAGEPARCARSRNHLRDSYLSLRRHAAANHRRRPFTIETAVHEELHATLGTTPYERSELRRGYRNGTKARTLTGPTGPVALTLPRATLFAGEQEWRSKIVPRYHRRMPAVNEAIVATYLAGGNTRRIRGALQPLLKAAPLSKSAVSRVIATLKDGLEAWRTRSLAELDVIYVYLDAFALRVRRAGKVVSAPVLGVVAVLSDGRKHLLALELCGGESFAAWKGCLDNLIARGLQAPMLAVIDGNAGLRRALGEIWPRAAVQRCCVHKLRNLERKAPKHVLAEIRDDFHRIVYATSADAARGAYATFEHTWAKRCPGVVTSLREGGEELLTFFRFPKVQWKTLRTTNTIERLHEEFRRRVKTQGSLPTEDAALVLLFSLVASGQIRLRRIDGWRKIASVLRQSTPVAA